MVQLTLDHFIDIKEKQLLDTAYSLAAEQRMGTNGEFVRGVNNDKRRKK